MAIITEEPDTEPEPQQQPRKPKKDTTLKPQDDQTLNPKATEPLARHKKAQNNPFIFWFYFTLSVTLITLLTITFSSISTSPDAKSFFLSLSPPLRQHFSGGRTIKVQIARNQPSTEIFTVESGKVPDVTEKVVIVHGLGLSSFSFRKVLSFLGSRGIHCVVFDLPGNGFSEKTMEVVEERGNGVLERLLDVYQLIKEKGVFWAFDNVVETGQIPYQEIQSHFSREKSVVKPIVLGSEEMGRVLGQVIEALELAPVHLVLHDSSLGMVANWVLENSRLVRSVTLVDTGSRSALPMWVLEIPVVRELVLGYNFAYERLLGLCCTKGIGRSNLEAHRLILRGRDCWRAVVGSEKKLNSSFDVADWGGLDELKEMPMQVIWSSSWSKEWSEEGRRVAEALPQAKFVAHSGGRWPQEDVADELAESIVKFVTSLPKSARQVEKEPIPEHIQKMFDEANGNDNHHHHHHMHHDHGHGGHDHGHPHMHATGAGYMDAYGLGHGWGH